MPDSLAKEIHDASQDGRLAAVDIDTVVRWIRMALDLDEMHEKIGFVKMLILKKSKEISTARPSFTAGELVAHLGGIFNDNAQSVIIAALHDLCTEGKIVALDLGKPVVYSFINGFANFPGQSRLAVNGTVAA